MFILLLDFLRISKYLFENIKKKKKLIYRLTHALCITLCVCSSLVITEKCKKSLLFNALKTSYVCSYLLRVCLQFICNDSDPAQKSLLCNAQRTNHASMQVSRNVFAVHLQFLGPRTTNKFRLALKESVTHNN